MKLMMALFIALAVVLLGMPVSAGPLTGAPAIQFKIGGTGDSGRARAAGAIGLSVCRFGFMESFTGAAGDTVDIKSVYYGPQLVGEAHIPLTASGDSSVTLGGWIAPINGDNGWFKYKGLAKVNESLTFGEIHARYNLNRMLGFEVGSLLFDASKHEDVLEPALGRLMAHGVLQVGKNKPGSASAQLGLGIIQGLPYESTALNVHKADWKTGASMYANVSVPITGAISANLSLWSLYQKWEYSADYRAATGNTSLVDTSRFLVQWSLGAGGRF